MQKFNQLIGHYRTFVSLIIGVVFLWVAKPDLNSLIRGIPFILLGELIRTWAAGSINKEYEKLTIWGPYAYTRNPLYVGSFLLGFGFVIMANQWVLLLIFLFLFLFVYRSTILDEENTLSRVFGEAFAEYKRKVPRFIPRLSPRPNVAPNFSWKRVLKHREYNAWLGITIGIMCILFKVIKGI